MVKHKRVFEKQLIVKEVGIFCCCSCLWKRGKLRAIFFAFVWLNAVPGDTAGRFGRHRNRHLVPDPACRCLPGGWGIPPGWAQRAAFPPVKGGITFEYFKHARNLSFFYCNCIHVFNQKGDRLFLYIYIHYVRYKYLTLGSFHTCLKLPWWNEFLKWGFE